MLDGLTPMHDFEVLRFPYAQIGTRPLELKLTRPRGPGPFPALLDLHGGAWTHFDHEVDFAWCEALARRGIAMCSVEFRTGPEDPWPAFHDDARAAARYVRHHAPALGIDPRMIGAMGGSTGGHMAVLLGLRPSGGAIAPLDTPPETSAAIDFAVALYPILDVPGRYAMARETRFDPLTRAVAARLMARFRRSHEGQGGAAGSHPKLGDPVPRLRRLQALRAGGGLRARAGDAAQLALWLAGKLPLLKAIEYEGLVVAHDGVFPSTAAMTDASPLHIVREGRAEAHPPILVIQGEDDPNMRAEMTWAFATAYQAAGGAINVDMRARHGHGFANVPSAKSEAMCDQVRAFVATQARQRAG